MTPSRAGSAKVGAQELDLVVQGNTAFALDLYGKLRQAEGNLFFSPYSLSTALAMTYAGARGDTAAQMAEALHFHLEPDRLHPAFAGLQNGLNAIQAQGDILLRIANALWPHQERVLLEEYLALVEEHYGVLIQSLDYRDPEAARGVINAWVEKETEGKIQDLIAQGVLDDQTRLVLTNAIYFKGMWASPFREDRTDEAPFWVAPDRKVKVPMMAQQLSCRLRESRDLQVLELPYAGDDCSMLVLLPRDRDGLAGLEASLTPDSLTAWLRSERKRSVRVFMPRFKTTSQFGLGETLKTLGMVDAFDGKADFSGMDGSKWLQIGAVIHQAYVDVNEEGTEAAAATGVVMMTKASFLPEPTFRADHPFVFLIRDNRTQSVLFLGRVVDPTG